MAPLSRIATARTPVAAAYVVGADGRVERAYYGVKATGHVARLRKDLGV